MQEVAIVDLIDELLINHFAVAGNNVAFLKVSTTVVASAIVVVAGVVRILDPAADGVIDNRRSVSRQDTLAGV